MSLYRTHIEIWTRFDPSNSEIDALASEAMTGDAICTIQTSMSVPETNVNNGEVREFFRLDDPDSWGD